MSLPNGQMPKDVNIDHAPWIIFEAGHSDFQNMKPIISNKNAFYSKENVKKIQQLLIKSVFQQSQGRYTIEKQEPRSFIEFMAQAYELNPGLSIPELNKKVIAIVTPRILVTIRAQIQYKKYLFEEAPIMDNGIDTRNDRGNRGL